jgi:sulfite reductase (ferredoxin)
MVDAYYFCVGGAVGKYAAVARPVGYRVAATEVPLALERLLRTYLVEREPAENLRTYFGRHTEEELRNRLSGAHLEAVERDQPTGPVPHGVAG